MICEINLPGYLAHLHEKKIQTIILFSVFVLQYLSEHIFPQQKKYNSNKNESFNVFIGIFNAAILFIPSALIVEMLSRIDKNNFGLLQQFWLPGWASICLTILAMDFFMYWWHRLNHIQGFLWRFHRFHHLDEKMNSTTALRFHTVELLFSVILKAIVFLLMGFSFIPVLIYEALFFAAIVVHHSNIRITNQLDMLYRKIFSSPLMHRIHHSNKQKETDSNYGSLFSFWDRIFNSYREKPEEPVVFGVDEKHS